MKISERTRFSHPVLCPDTSDYATGVFGVTFTVEEDHASGGLNLHCEALLSESAIERELAGGAARIGLDVRCGDTYHASIRPITLGTSTISFAPGELSGRVIIRPVIWTVEAIEGFRSEGFNDEYGGSTFTLNRGDLLAWDEDIVISVGRRKLAPLDSIFELSRDDSIGASQFSVYLDSQKIQIVAAKDVFEHIHLMRQSDQGRAIVLNSVYFPAVMQVLNYIADEGGRDYADYMWYQAFIAKCDHYGLSLNNQDLIQHAMTLLKSPYSQIRERFRD